MNLPFAWALVLAGFSGFIALAYEILWARFYSFACSSRAEAFGAMLGSYLCGLAVGSLWSRRWQRRAAAGAKPGLLTLSRLVLVSSTASFLVVPLASWMLVKCTAVGNLPQRTLPLVMLGATLQGIVLPLLCHYAIAADTRAGARMSFIYLANITGSGAGTLVTGFLLMDFFGLGQIALMLLLFGLLISICLARLSRTVRWADWLGWGVAVVLAVASARLHQGLYERLFYQGAYRPGSRFERTLESRHGVITVDTNRCIYGGGVYDGMIDTELTLGSGMVRPYFLSALHPQPGEILMIGVSGGAWTQILAHHPQAEKVTAVEISRGYLEVIRAYPQVSSLVTNPKVEIVIDDGRRWLRRHPERRFDAILINATFHWRELASALLSREFLELVRDHLRPGGLAMWNCTGSARAIRTGLEVFPHTLMVMNNCVGSLTPLTINHDRWRSVLARYRIDGRPVFDLATPAGRRSFEEVLRFGDNKSSVPNGWRVLDRKKMQERYGRARLITDDNLGEEYPDTLGDLFAPIPGPP
jgi:spermidine synthase